MNLKHLKEVLIYKINMNLVRIINNQTLTKEVSFNLIKC